MERRKSNFTNRVHSIVRAIPRGKTLSYGEVASRAGSPGAARRVGTLMKNNTDPEIPCHRVIKADGSVGEYNRGGSKRKLQLLRAEGVSV